MAMSLSKLRRLPSLDALVDYFSYDGTTGIITRKGKHTELGYIHPVTGYRLISYYENGKKIGICAHRLAYALYHKVDPYPQEIDHINRNKLDNRIINLRAATHSQNQLNKCLQRNNTSGYTGVKHFVMTRGGVSTEKWEVWHRRKYCGTYYDFDEAVAARKALEM